MVVVAVVVVAVVAVESSEEWGNPRKTRRVKGPSIKYPFLPFRQAQEEPNPWARNTHPFTATQAPEWTAGVSYPNEDTNK